MATFTLFETQTALDRVKSKFENGCKLAMIPEDRYADAVDIMKNHFVPDEPVCNGYGVEWEKTFEDVVFGILRKNLSVMMLSADGNVMGVLLVQPIQSGKLSDIDQITYEPLRETLKFYEQRGKIDLYGHFGVDEAMHFVALATHRDHRRRGVGKGVLGAAVALTAELGFKAIRVEGTSNYTQMICDREGFKVLLEVPYDRSLYKGEALRGKTGPHALMKVVGKAL